jgi:hypothetical protein
VRDIERGKYAMPTEAAGTFVAVKTALAEKSEHKRENLRQCSSKLHKIEDFQKNFQNEFRNDPCFSPYI